jgi:hypothetical protein
MINHQFHHVDPSEYVKIAARCCDNTLGKHAKPCVRYLIGLIEAFSQASRQSG